MLPPRRAELRSADPGKAALRRRGFPYSHRGQRSRTFAAHSTSADHLTRHSPARAELHKIARTRGRAAEGRAALTLSSPASAGSLGAMMLALARTRQPHTWLPVRACPVQRLVSERPFFHGRGRVARCDTTSGRLSTRTHGCPAAASKRPGHWCAWASTSSPPTRATRSSTRR